MSRPRAGAAGGHPGAGNTRPVRIEVARPASGFNPLPELDAVLIGLIALDDPATSIVTEEWIESGKWQRVARVLLRHRRAGGKLGDIFLATRVVLDADIDFGGTFIAEALIATTEAVPARYIISQARRRLPRLRLRRLAQLLLVTASSEPAAIAAVCRGAARHELDRIVGEVVEP